MAMSAGAVRKSAAIETTAGTMVASMAETIMVIVGKVVLCDHCDFVDMIEVAIAIRCEVRNEKRGRHVRWLRLGDI